MQSRARIVRAFTLFELMVTLVIVGILTAVALPSAKESLTYEGEAAGRRLASDIEYARSYCIARPDSRLVVQIDKDAGAYWLALESDALRAPIAHPVTGKPYRVEFAMEPGMSSVVIAESNVGADGALHFDSMGGLAQATPATVILKVGGSKFVLEIAPAAAEVVITRQ